MKKLKKTLNFFLKFIIRREMRSPFKKNKTKLENEIGFKKTCQLYFFQNISNAVFNFIKSCP